MFMLLLASLLATPAPASSAGPTRILNVVLENRLPVPVTLTPEMSPCVLGSGGAAARSVGKGQYFLLPMDCPSEHVLFDVADPAGRSLGKLIILGVRGDWRVLVQDADGYLLRANVEPGHFLREPLELRLERK